MRVIKKGQEFVGELEKIKDKETLQKVVYAHITMILKLFFSKQESLILLKQVEKNFEDPNYLV